MVWYGSNWKRLGEADDPPWLTAITSSLLRILKVSLSMDLISHPISRGACTVNHFIHSFSTRDNGENPS